MGAGHGRARGWHSSSQGTPKAAASRAGCCEKRTQEISGRPSCASGSMQVHSVGLEGDAQAEEAEEDAPVGERGLQVAAEQPRHPDVAARMAQPADMATGAGARGARVPLRPPARRREASRAREPGAEERRRRRKAGRPRLAAFPPRAEEGAGLRLPWAPRPGPRFPAWCRARVSPPPHHTQVSALPRLREILQGATCHYPVTIQLRVFPVSYPTPKSGGPCTPIGELGKLKACDVQ